MYRDAASPVGTGQAPAPTDAGPRIPPDDGERAIEVSPTLLFRFSH